MQATTNRTGPTVTVITSEAYEMIDRIGESLCKRAGIDWTAGGPEAYFARQAIASAAFRMLAESPDQHALITAEFKRFAQQEGGNHASE